MSVVDGRIGAVEAVGDAPVPPRESDAGVARETVERAAWDVCQTHLAEYGSGARGPLPPHVDG